MIILSRLNLQPKIKGNHWRNLCMHLVNPWLNLSMQGSLWLGQSMHPANRWRNQCMKGIQWQSLISQVAK